MDTHHAVFSKEFGPILYALGDGKYRVLWYGPQEPACLLNADAITPTPLRTFADHTFWTFDITLPPAEDTTEHTYSINSTPYTFAVPGTQTKDLRIAFASCNGSEAETPFTKPFPGRNALWEHMYDTHAEEKYHILIQGGDQLYADSVWRDIAFLVEWRTLPREEQYTTPMPDEVFEEIRSYYFACYLSYWAQPHIRDAMATIPNIMIWDDHDIFDGWGSWNDRWQASPVYQGLFRAARDAFYLFQRGEIPPADINTASIAITMGHTAFVVPDLRSERTRKDVMGAEGWTWLETTLQSIGNDKQHMILVSSVPLATSHFSALDPILTGFPSFIARRLPKKINPKQFADDIHDQWRVPAHRKEWLRMLNRLLDFAEETDTRVSTLSGEIHLGARSTIKRRDAVIHQFIASGISHKPASSLVVWFCELLSKGVQDVSKDIDVRMEHFFPTGRRRYLRARNWLSLELTQDKHLRACWNAENREPIHFED